MIYCKINKVNVNKFLVRNSIDEERSYLLADSWGIDFLKDALSSSQPWPSPFFLQSSKC
jgi:hypothetical protein